MLFCISGMSLCIFFNLKICGPPNISGFGMAAIEFGAPAGILAGFVAGPILTCHSLRLGCVTNVPTLAAALKKMRAAWYGCRASADIPLAALIDGIMSQSPCRAGALRSAPV